MVAALTAPIFGEDDVPVYKTPKKPIWRQGATYKPGDLLRCKNNMPCTRPPLKEGEKAGPDGAEEELLEPPVLF